MKKIPLIKPEFDTKKLALAFEKIAKSGILTKGEFLNDFELKLANYLKVKYVFATTSCTTALHLGLVALDIKSGDEVLVSDFSFPASGNVIVQVGAKPVFVDIDLETFDIDLEDLKKKITSKTKAIMVVHAFGYPADMSGIMKIAKKHHLAVIEDAACAIGSRHKEKYCGAWGDVGCFSFHPRKVITTGEGGAIVTNNPKIAERIAIYRNHGGIKTKKGMEFIESGFNYRLSELSAALGVEQLTKLETINKERRRIAKKYLDKLKNTPGLILPHLPPDGESNFQSFVVILPQKINREKMIEKLAKKNIETTLGTYAMHAQPAFRKYGYKAGQLANSNLAYQKSLTLPLPLKMTDQEIDYVVKNLKASLDDYN